MSAIERVRAGWVVAGLCSLGVVWTQTGTAAESPTGKSTAAAKWAAIDKWPDFTTGSWSNPGDRVGPGPDARGRVAPVPTNGILQAPLNAAYAAKVRAQDAQNGSGGSGAASCEPLGVIIDTGSKFYFTKDVIIITGEMPSSGGLMMRRVYLNRKEHGDQEPTYFGDSIGHWEGQTLVVDTTAIRAEVQLMTGVPVDSDATHMIERYRLIGPDTLELTKTVENPEVFTRPWVTRTKLTRTRGADFVATYCWHDREGNSATEAPDLTPPK